MGKKDRKERQKLAKVERQQIREEARKKNKKINLFKKISIFAVLVIVAFFMFKGISSTGAKGLFVESENINYGVVSQAQGVKTQEFLIRNDGKEPLTINNMDTSCMCTSISIIKEGIEGPKFGMSAHGTNPKGWSTTFAPGEEGKMKISYDPNAHKELMGPVTRFINIYSDKGAKRLTLKLVQAR